MGTANFIDYVRIYGQAGNGGDGMAHFRRERYVEKGGPDGGDGGRGGHVGIIADEHCSTLLHLRYNRHARAKHGLGGGRNNRQGAAGADLWLRVPVGTVAKSEGGEQLGEVLQAGDRLLLLEGGRHGKGNAHFVTSTRQAPDHAQQGRSGASGIITLELKLLAEVGLIGKPNAGKSTLISCLSAATSRIASYPFTTLHPVLGVVPLVGYRSFVMADLPGIIEGAAEGRGLGSRFLRHTERNLLLLFVISAEEDNILATYEALQKELRTYNPALCAKKQYVVVSKCDLLDESQHKKLSISSSSIPHHVISSHTQKGLERLKNSLWDQLHK